MKVLVGDIFGRLLGELDCLVGPTSWLLNDVGKTTLRVSRLSSKHSEYYLGIGNRVYIDMENGLPLWGGVIDTPTTWSQGMTTIQCYDIGKAYKSRVTDRNASFYEWTAGEVFKALILREEQKFPLGMSLGSVWTGGKLHWPRYNLMNVWQALTTSIREMERCDFQFIPYLTSSAIKFRAELYQVAGASKVGSVAFQEGINVADTLTLEEQGEIINTFYAVGSGTDWGADRPITVAKAKESVAEFGLREASRVYGSTSMPSTLEMYSRNALKISAYPRRIFRLPVVSHAPATFADFKLGDEVSCELPSFGFDGFSGSVRILGLEYSPQSGNCELVVEEPREVDYWVYQDDLEELEE